MFAKSFFSKWPSKPLLASVRSLAFLRGSLFDKARIKVVAGSGGRGGVAFETSGKLKKRPSGGHGGIGGDVWIEGSKSVNSLKMEKFEFKAKDGGVGGGMSKTGANGRDLIIKVPCGTEVIKNGEFLIDIVEAGEKILVCKGGQAGTGNQVLISESYRTNYSNMIGKQKDADGDFTPTGEAGEEAEIHLKLKLLADIGLVGFPNAGKSSILAAISKRKPKIAGYAFTTLDPMIGILQGSDATGSNFSIPIADIPGITETSEKPSTEGAITSRKTHDFLQHIERTSCFIYVLGLPSVLELGKYYKETEDTEFFVKVEEKEMKSIIKSRMQQEFKTLIEELEKYEKGLSFKPGLLALNKVDNLMDMFGIEQSEAVCLAHDLWNDASLDLPIMRPLECTVAISAKHLLGIDELKEAVASFHNNEVVSKAKKTEEITEDLY